MNDHRAYFSSRVDLHFQQFQRGTCHCAGFPVCVSARPRCPRVQSPPDNGIGTEGAKAIAAALETNTTLRVLALSVCVPSRAPQLASGLIGRIGTSLPPPESLGKTLDPSMISIRLR